MADPYVVSSMNFFIDSKDDANPMSRGDYIILNLGNQAINAGPGEEIKINLINFNMYRSFYQVNENNSRFILQINDSGTGAGAQFPPAPGTASSTIVCSIVPGNYQTTYQVYLAIADAIMRGINSVTLGAGNWANLTCNVQPHVMLAGGANTVMGVGQSLPQAQTIAAAPDQNTGQMLGQAEDGLFSIAFNIPTGITVNEFFILGFEELSDAYELGGWNKIPVGSGISQAAVVPNPFTVPVAGAWPLAAGVLPSMQTQTYTAGVPSPAPMFPLVSAGNSQVVLRNYYPAQTATDAYVYVRTNLMSNNIAQQNLEAKAAPAVAGGTSTSTTHILAKVPIDTEYANFNANFGGLDGSEYMAHISQKHIDTIEVYLTDSRGRQLGRPVQNNHPLTAGGLPFVDPQTFSNNDMATALGAMFQSTHGNMSFSAVINVQIIHAFNPKLLQTKPIPRTVTSRKIGVLQHNNFGASSYDDN